MNVATDCFALQRKSRALEMDTPNRTLGNMLAATSILHGATLGSQSPQPSPQNIPGPILPQPYLSPSRVLSKEMFMIRASSGPPVVATCSQTTEFVDNQWRKAFIMLQNNPTLMTGHILIIALRRRAPIQLIRFMLMLNPESVSVPRHGPSPLQVAVQCLCSIDVIKLLLEKCPTALVVTNPGSFLDPLSYANRFRSSETDLIALLSLPIEHWSVHIKSKSTSFSPKLSDIVNQQAGGMDTVTVMRSPAPLPRYHFLKTNVADVVVAKGSQAKKSRCTFDDLEMNNVKLICLAVLKGHRRISKEIVEVQKEVDRIGESVFTSSKKYLLASDVERLLQAHSSSLMKSVHDFQNKIGRSQLITMDMKANAMLTSVKEMESRVVGSVQKNLADTLANLERRVKAVSDGLQAHLQQFNDRINFAESTPVYTEPGIYISTTGATNISSPKAPELESVVDVCIEAVKTKVCAAPASSPSTFTYRSDDTPATALESDDDMWATITFPLQDEKLANENDEMLSLLANDIIVYRPFHHRRSHRKHRTGKRSLFCKLEQNNLGRHGEFEYL